jgi:protein-tyrosine phosphatase
MIPLVDIHCHLLAGLDDGPRSQEDALAMCRMAYGEGVRMVAATAHQNKQWDSVTPDGIRQATQQLAERLHEAGIRLLVFPSAEIMVHAEVEACWSTGTLLSIADHRQYLLLEMPHELCVDLRPLVLRLRETRVRPILAHPERHEELLHEAGRIEQLIHAGCLVQVSSASVTDPPSAHAMRALKSWFKRGIVHVLGSDGHSVTHRPPRMAAAYRQIARWAGVLAADRMSSTNGIAVLQGLPLRIPQPESKRTVWSLGLR